MTEKLDESTVVNVLKLEDFLDKFRAEGQVEDEGCFTISHEQATQKIIEYSLPRENAWVLFLVQSAVLMGCSELEITQSRVETCFHFLVDKPDCDLSVESLVNSIMKADLRTMRAMDKLGSALRLLVDKCGLSFLAQIDSGDGSPKTVYSGHFYSDPKERKRASVLSDFPSKLSIAVHHIPHSSSNRLLLRYLPFKKLSLPLLEELQACAYTSPLPIAINGQRIDGLLKSSGLPWTPFYKPLWVRPLKVSLEGNPPAIQFCQHTRERVFTLDAPLLEANEANSKRPRGQASLTLAAEFSKFGEPLQTKRRSHLHWLKNGIIAESEELEAKTKHLSLHVFANALGLRADFSGFSLLRESKYFERKASILDSARKALIVEAPKLGDIHSQPPFKKKADVPGPDGYVEIEMKYRAELDYLVACLADMIWAAKQGPPEVQPKHWRPPADGDQSMMNWL